MTHNTMRQSFRWRAVCSGLVVSLCIYAVGPNIVRADETHTAKVYRKLFVPFDDLHVLLESSPEHIFLSQDEYRNLLAKAQRTEEESPPRAAAILSANYDGKIESGRLLLKATIEVEVLAKGLQLIDLPVKGVAIHDANVGGQPAVLWNKGDGRVRLLLDSVGSHSLSLTMSAPVVTTAAKQSLNIQVPVQASGKFTLSVPGDVEIKSGASVIHRQVSDDDPQTTFDLLVPRSGLKLEMSLNSHLVQQQQVVASKAVQLAEVTEAYDRLYSTFSQNVLHGEVSAFAFDIPDDLEIVDVRCAEMADWKVLAEPARQLVVNLRAPATETVIVQTVASSNARGKRCVEFSENRSGQCVGLRGGRRIVRGYSTRDS